MEEQLKEETNRKDYWLHEVNNFEISSSEHNHIFMFCCRVLLLK